jgi:hypothetical protein
MRASRACVKNDEDSVTSFVAFQQFGAAATSPPMFINEGQLSDLLELLQEETNGAVPLDIQTLALKAITALWPERSRQNNVLLTAGSPSHHGLLPSMIRKAKLLLNDHSGDYKVS